MNVPLPYPESPAGYMFGARIQALFNDLHITSLPESEEYMHHYIRFPPNPLSENSTDTHMVFQKMGPGYARIVIFLLINHLEYHSRRVSDALPEW